MTTVLEEVRTRAADPSHATDDALDGGRAERFPMLSARQVDDAERKLGFTLPPLLRSLYTTVGNGGFGPAYGLLGLVGGARNEDGQDSASIYLSYRQPDPGDPHWRWPERLLPIGHLGCAMFACVDCTTEDGAMIWFEPNPHEPGEPWDDSFVPLGRTLEEWLADWLAGVDMLERLGGGDA